MRTLVGAIHLAKNLQLTPHVLHCGQPLARQGARSVENPSFVALDFPPWIRWGQRRGASIDNIALARAHSDHRHWTHVGDGALGFVGTVYHCGWCGAPCGGRRTAWCSETCSTRYYRVWSWGALVQYIRERDGDVCRRCFATDPGAPSGARYSAWEVDHIVPVRDGGDDNPDNLRLLCAGCHVAVGYEQRAESAARSAREGSAR